MRIGIHTRYIEQTRIDGTAVYIHHLLRRLPTLLSDLQLYYYHTDTYHPECVVPPMDNVYDRLLPRLPLWTQTAFATALWRDECDVAWLPIHTLPLIRRRTLRTVVTIHDLAFKFYPATFPQSDVRMLNILTDYAATHADAIIAVSEATKNDLLQSYPCITPDRVHVVYHGVDVQQWQRASQSTALEAMRSVYRLGAAPYIIHVGAIQPRKNLTFLVDAFARVKVSVPEMKLVLVGGDGWKAAGIHAHIARSPFREDIVVTGNIAFADVVALVRGACVGVLPSLYEGFGIPGLEMLAAGIPLAAAQASCFPEVYGDAAVYFNPNDVEMCAEYIVRLHADDALRQTLISRGVQRARQFTWDDTAIATARVLRTGGYVR